jgi:hypothetical protein
MIGAKHYKQQCAISNNIYPSLSFLNTRLEAMKKPKSYSDFTLDHLREMFGIKNTRRKLDFANTSLAPSSWLLTTLTMNRIAPLNSEKAKSELLITPILVELMNRNLDRCTYFSGPLLDVDAAQSLRGRCDFLLTREMSADVSAPIIALFEAKDDSLDHWYGQCGAEMLAARIFNEQRNEPITIIHGGVTNGFTWQFLRLEGLSLLIDTEMYSLSDLPKLLGALNYLIDFYHQ